MEKKKSKSHNKYCIYCSCLLNFSLKFRASSTGQWKVVKKNISWKNVVLMFKINLANYTAYRHFFFTQTSYITYNSQKVNCDKCKRKHSWFGIRISLMLWLHTFGVQGTYSSCSSMLVKKHMRKDVVVMMAFRCYKMNNIVQRSL